MCKRCLKDNLQRSKRSLKIIRDYEDEMIKLNTLKIRSHKENSRSSTRKASTKEERILHSRKEDKALHFSRLGALNTIAPTMLVDCPKAIEKEKGALEAKLEAIEKKKKDLSESEGEEKASMCFMALENEVQFLPSNLSNFVVVDDDDPNSMLIEMYDELKKISKRTLKKEKDFSNLEFQKLVIENKNLCEKVLSLEKCMEDYND
ncbi:hypothetical protein M9H77_16635 [Catharanthus roseus]|uniref:Uncharacterized protein n=1 Tax=Catharanthus roseus TaxID=4058 RepID=A0ACC0B2B2_CATRO|nr:hypothetical protein M9H77_16635 [Catharanthus roseus]